MARRQRYTLIYAPQVQQHLQAIPRKHHSPIRERIEEQLEFDAESRTTNRKPLQEPLLGAAWELRFGPENCFRVFYAVDSREPRVQVLAIGMKERERLRIGGEEIDL